MSRDSGRKATATVKATAPRKATGTAATVPAPVATDAPATGPVLTLSTGRNGRPSTSDVDNLAAARAILRDALRTLKAPAPARAPHGASQRVRAAIAADNAATAAAYAMLRDARIA